MRERGYCEPVRPNRVQRDQHQAQAGLDRWKERHAAVWPYLEPADVLVDSMRGRSSTWTRIRLNLRHVPEAERPSQEELDVDYDPSFLGLPATQPGWRNELPNRYLLYSN